MQQGNYMEAYISEYRQKDDSSLQRSLRALSGQPDMKAKERIRAIKQVIAERLGQVDAVQLDQADEGDDPQTFDELVARKFISKLENAKKRGVGFSLTLSDMRRLMMRKTCHYTGIRMEDDCDPMEPQKRTLERLDQSKGYSKDNTVACCFAANALKNAVFEDPISTCRMTKAQFRRFAKSI